LLSDARPLGIDHALATESVQRLVQGGVFPRRGHARLRSKLAARQEAALELVVVRVILAMMLILSLR
jgi:hypothetical protein